MLTILLARAWVEMTTRPCSTRTTAVALLAEGVGRNQGRDDTGRTDYRRPPRGGRG